MTNPTIVLFLFVLSFVLFSCDVPYFKGLNLLNKGALIIYVTLGPDEIYRQPKKSHDPPLAHT